MSISSRIIEMEQHIGNAYDKIEDLGIDLTNVDKNIDNIATMLEDVWNEYPKVTATDVEEATLNGTKKGRMEIDLKGQTSQETAILPSEYQQVEYIESTGTQYIDSTFKPDENSKIECTLQLTDLYSDSQEGAILFGIASLAGGSANTRIVAGLGLNPIRFYAGLGANNYTQNVSDGNVFFNKMKYFVDLKNNTYGYDNNSYNGTQPVNYRTQNVSAYIFARRGTNGVAERKAKMKLYNCKCYSSNILVNDFIPCYKKSDNEIGLYDIVTNTFLTNAGTGDFTKGNDITSLPTPEFPIPIKNVTGNANIKIQNKNLLNLQNINIVNRYGVTYTSQQDESLLISGTKYGYNITNLSNNTMFLKSGDYICNSVLQNGSILKNGSNFYVNINLKKVGDSNFNINIGGLGRNSKKAFTITEDANYYIQFDIWDDNVVFDNANVTIQVEQGSTATSYISHQEQNYPFTFAEGQFLAENEKLQDNGMLKKWKQVTFSGTTITLEDAKTNGAYFCNKKVAGNLVGQTLTFDEEVTNAVIQYELAEPDTIQYNSTQQAQYDAIKQARSYDDQTNISSKSDELGFNMNVESLGNINKVINNLLNN